MLVLLAALDQELSAFKKSFVVRKAAEVGGYEVQWGECGGRSVLLMVAGMGKQNAEDATEIALNESGVTAIVSLGFGGALSNAVKPGELIICNSMSEADNGGDRINSDPALVSILSHALEADGFPFGVGICVSVPKPVLNKETRLELARKSGAEIVDMESYWAGRVALVHKMPFIAVRAVSDTVEDDLPSFESLLDKAGKLPVGVLSRYVITHPWRTSQFVTLYRQAQAAGKSLAVAARCLVSSYEGA